MLNGACNIGYPGRKEPRTDGWWHGHSEGGGGDDGGVSDGSGCDDEARLLPPSETVLVEVQQELREVSLRAASSMCCLRHICPSSSRSTALGKLWEKSDVSSESGALRMD